jgi:putative SOS response-associated peptidase YedK
MIVHSLWFRRNEEFMCTSYKTGKDIDFRALFDADPPLGEWREEVYKDYTAPIILRDAAGQRAAQLATFGIVPHKHIPQGVKVFDTMNCRSESVATKRSFSGAWKAGQLCLIACTAFYEPNYDTGKAVRWRIGMADGRPFAIAGLWRAWNEAAGTALSFTMLNQRRPSPAHASFSSAGRRKTQRHHRATDAIRGMALMSEFGAGTDLLPVAA